MNAPALNPQLLRLSTLLDLERRAREAQGAELSYLIVNDTIGVAPYQHAALWRNGRLVAVSGVSEPDPGAPYVGWLRQVFAAVEKQAAENPAAARPVDPASLSLPAEAWAQWFPPAALFVPLPDPRGGVAGGLLLGRQDPWHPAECQLLEALAGTYGLTLAAAELPRKRKQLAHHRRLLWVVAAVGLAALSLTPIRSSVLAPADVVAAAPFPVRAPFDGVVDTVHVQPNAPVHKNDRLLTFETTERQAKTDVAAKALEMAHAELREASQQAFLDPRAKGRIALLQSKVAQAQLEYDYDRTMLGRAEVLAPADGVAVFDDANQWIGKPTQLGERIMTIAPPLSTDLDIAVPVGDVVTFDPRADVVFFPNITPDVPAHGHLVAAGYASAPTADGVLAYTFRAQLDDVDAGLRLGLKGTVKIYGARRPFLLWALRRPLAVMREWLSL